jgi:hypothetical protein
MKKSLTKAEVQKAVNDAYTAFDKFPVDGCMKDRNRVRALLKKAIKALETYRAEKK